MCNFEKIWLENCLRHFKPIIYRRFVDDTLNYNAFMCNFEKIWLENCLRHFKPIIYRRFVDDTFSLLQSKEHVEKFRNYLNKQHKI